MLVKNIEKNIVKEYVLNDVFFIIDNVKLMSKNFLL